MRHAELTKFLSGDCAVPIDVKLSKSLLELLNLLIRELDIVHEHLHRGGLVTNC